MRWSVHCIADGADDVGLDAKVEIERNEHDGKETEIKP
jgi:hypothetical protein